VVVDGANSSDVWAGFRVGQRARVQLTAATASPAAVVIQAAHDGFRRLVGHNGHQRCWRLDRQELFIEDHITGRFGAAEAHFHVHPDLVVEPAGEHTWILHGRADLRVRISFERPAAARLVQGSWHPRFGVGIMNHCLVVRFGADTLRTHVTWDARA
jgi:hypothetical protein